MAGVAEIVRRSHGDYGRGRFSAAEAPLPAANAPRSRNRQAKASSQNPSRADRALLSGLSEFLDETGMPVLYTSGRHYVRQAGGRITFPDQRWLWFPVRGTSSPNAIMTAVDQAGNKVARYRVTGKLGLQYRMEITVHPGQQLTDELALAIMVSAPWLWSYFKQPGSK